MRVGRSQAAGRAARRRPGGRAEPLCPRPPRERRRGTRLPGGGGRCRHRRGVLRARGSAVHHPADRGAGSGSQAARHGWRGRGPRSGRDARLPRPEGGWRRVRSPPEPPLPARLRGECASTCGPGSPPAGARSRGGGRRCCSPRPRVD